MRKTNNKALLVLVSLLAILNFRQRTDIINLEYEIADKNIEMNSMRQGYSEQYDNLVDVIDKMTDKLEKVD